MWWKYVRSEPEATLPVLSEEFLYKVVPPELKISPFMYFVIHKSVVLSKILKIVVQNFENSIFDCKIDYFDNNRHRQTGVKMAQRFSIFWVTPLNCGWQNT